MERKLMIIGLLIGLLICESSLASNVPAIFIFGDSIFDAGNNHYNRNCTAQADFPPYGSNFFHRPTGRFTNGRTVPDFICEFLGIELQKPFMEIVNGSQNKYPSNGINFASAGSGLLQSTNIDMRVTPIQTQLQQFQTLVDQNHIDPKLIQESLFFLESGSNDIFNFFSPLEPPTVLPGDYVQSMLSEVENFLNVIYKLGARRIVVFGLGPVGCVPARALFPSAPVAKCFGKMNKMAKDFNMGLEKLVSGIPAEYPRAVGVYGAVYETVQIFRANPKRYGFSNVTDACCGYGILGGQMQCGMEGYTMCKNPNEYVFWDLFHPSEHTYKLISKVFWAGNQSRIRPFNLMTMTNSTTKYT